METYCIYKVFDDFDAFTKTAQGWDIDFKQMQAKPFKGILLQYIQGDVHFAHAQLNNHIEQLGNPPKGLRTFAIPANRHLRLNWLGANVPDDSILVFQPHRGLDCVSWNDFDMYVLSMPQHQISELCFELGYPALPATIQQSDIIRCRPGALAEFRQVLVMFANILEQFMDKTPQWLQEEIQYTIPIVLIRTLASYEETTLVKSVRMRDNVIQQIKAYLSTSLEMVPKISELCNMFHISERTLEYAFRERIGVTPKRYLKTLRLNQVHKTLRQRPQQMRKIVDVANYFGFWHMGQFAADYKKLFGELPSDTFDKHNLLSVTERGNKTV